jgi:uncharacterized protein (TIGR03067 family)
MNEYGPVGAASFGGVFVGSRTKRRKAMRIAIASVLASFYFLYSGPPGVRADEKADVEKELKKFQGVWTFDSVEMGGMKDPPENLKDMTLSFEGAKHTVTKAGQAIQSGTQTIDPSKSPKTIDVTITEGPSKGLVMLGIYDITGDTLKVCFDMGGKKRPTEFKSAPGSATFFNVHKRMKK